MFTKTIKKSQEEIKIFNQNTNKTINSNSNIKAYWNFFPTPSHLIIKMLEDYKNKPLPKNILEPSAGKGDIIDYINKIQIKRKQKSNIYAFEFVEELQEIIKEKQNCKLLGNNFLEYRPSKKIQKTTQQPIFDLIVMNPPFDRGAEHVLQAWQLLQNNPKEAKVIALLNKHTYYNPYNSHRLKLKTLIDQYGTIENLGRCFTEKSSERPARVDVIKITLTKKANTYYQDIGINLAKYPYEMIRRNKGRYIVKDFIRLC